MGRISSLRIFLFSLALTLCCEFSIFAQGRQNFTLFGDVKVDDTRIEDRKPVTLDILLYKGGALIGRQRLGNFGRYRFMNLLAGVYEVAVEIENVEVTRITKLIAGQYADDVRQDINLMWRPTVERRGKAEVVSVEDSYTRTDQNKSLFQRAEREIADKDHVAAIATLKSLVSSDPKDAPAWVELGMLQFIQKEYAEAEKSFFTAMTVKPDYFSALLNLGRVRLARKRFEGAAKSLHQALQIKPNSGSANYFLGEAYLQMKEGSIAAGYLNQALKLDPSGMAEAHLRLAALYSAAGRKDAAASECEQFLKKRPDYSDRKEVERCIANKTTPKID
jgi:tetratricopeptide (TPR) repeat protein